jgi:hypothetical protein
LKEPLKKRIDLRGLKFHDAVKGKEPYIGYEFGCEWEQEHGVGVMMHGTRVVEMGGADVAILEWIADRDARKRTKPAKAKKKTRAR